MSGNREILMKFITGQNEKVRQDISMQGYKDTSPYRNNPSNTIYGTSQGTPITMQGVSTPLVGMDEFGNRQEMYPGQTYEFPGTRVVETPIAKSGGQMIKRADGSYSQRGLWDNIRAAKGSGKKPTKEMLQQEKKIKSEYKNGGSLLTKTMTCSNCGWSWKAADGGNDVTTCHKCGGEALLNAQAGGDTYKFGPIPITHGDFYNVNLTKSQYKKGGTWFGNADEMSVSNKYQRAGTVKKPKLGAGQYYTTTGKVVIWGTPEYEKAYNRGEVLSEDGVRSEVTLDGGKLEDVVIKGKKRKKGFWEQSRDAYLKEHQDDGLFGAIGSVVTYPLGLAQQAMMYGLTDKVQKPSEVVGFKNNEGWFANPSSFGKNLTNLGVDIVTDPTNWIGLGELNTAGRLTKAEALAKLAKIETRVASELMGGVRTNGPSFGSFVDNVTPTFKSEIDWGKWNKEIPKNTQLMDEYNAIEQTTKANGSWMKNPDGSAFQGTPEQFVQQNSENFKKAFGNSKLINPDGSPTKLYHGTQSKLINDEFNLDYFGKTDPGFMGRGVYLSGHKGISHHYAYPTKAERINGTLQVKDYLPGEAEKLFPNSEIYEVYGNVQKPINLSEINTNDLYKRFNRLDVEDNLSQYDAAIHDFKRKDGLIQEINIANPKNIKSATGNNGMFDMTNPNIYKAIVPGAIGLGALQQEEEGGVTKYDIGGTTVAEQYTQITGKPWSTARAEGLTDGSAKQNLALIERLKNPQPVVVEKNTTQPVAIEEPVYSNEELHRKELAKRVVQLAEERIKNNNYIDVPSDVKEASYLRGEVPFGCIGGACTVLKDAGVMKNVDWSNTHFAENAKEYGFTANNGWGVKGIKNLEPGDLLMYNQHKNAQGNYYPSHSQIYLGKTDTGRYRFFDNFRKEVREYDQSDIEEKVDPSRKKTEMSATIYKVNPFIDDNMLGLSEQALKNLADKKEFIEKESTSKSSYKWKIASDSKDYNNTTKRVMDNFIAFANDNDKINDLVKKTGKSKAEIQDSLLNVFGELGVENNWTTSKGKGLGSRLENIAESLLTAVGGGKGLSVGPGQIKYSELQKEADAAKKAGTPSLKEQFNITSPNDLYDLNKVLPLMTAMDLRDKQVLEKWSENNTLSQKLFGWTRPEIENGGGQGVTTGGFKVDQLSTETDNSILNNGVGRYSPYLRNQYSSINSGTSYQGNNDWIPFNEGTVPNFSPAMYNTSGQDEMKIKYQRDPGSYPYKVESNWRNNLNRLITPNEDGTIELNEVVVKSKKKR